MLPAKGAGSDAAPSGVMVRDRQTQRDLPASKRGAGEDDATSAVTNTDIEYQAGRRIEQIVGTPGSIRKISIGVVVPKGVTQDRLDRVRELTAMAAGIDKQRGDGIAVYSLDQMSDGPPSLTPLEPPMVAAPEQQMTPAKRDGAPIDTPAMNYLAGALALALVLAFIGWIATAARRRGAVPAGPTALAAGERAALLDNMQQWLDAPAPRLAQERPE